ncbi:MAG: hypothetical protein ACRDRW_19315 [Pseudonocardiaceae bacterium]
MIVSNIFSTEIDITGLDRNFARADIEFHEVDHSEASFEARVFLNNDRADEHTEKSVDNGYAGSFHILGHGGCYGDEGHCDVVPRRRYDPRPAHPLTPARKVVIATDAIRRAVRTDQATASLTMVPIITSLNEKCGTENILRFDYVRITTYR